MIEARHFKRMQRMSSLLALCAVLAACEAGPGKTPDEPPEPGVAAPTRVGPEGAAPGTCWGKTVSPAVIETVREEVQVKPAKFNPDGTLSKLPVFRSETRQEIVVPRKDNWFETPCAEVLTQDFTASLQRALQARGRFAGAITGQMDVPTRAAVQRLQVEQGGPNSSVLSLETARSLGLIAVEREG